MTLTIRWLAMPLAAVALGATACGAANNAASDNPTVPNPPAAAPADHYLTDGSGEALYLFLPDPAGVSTCTGTCASIWPPLSPDSQITARGGVNRVHVATIARSDGSGQLTYYRHPLYHYLGDHRPGQTTGQGLDQFGGKWYLISAAGTKIDSD
jgi:predicted lipoprotein with Yx(FWY)xxD motif